MTRSNAQRLSVRTMRPAALLLAAVAALRSFCSIEAQAATVTWTNTGGSAWLSTTNWSVPAGPGATDIAQFGVNPTGSSAIGISMSGTTNNGTANEAVGAIEIASARTSSLTINNSSSTTAGVLTLNGATVNGVSDVVLHEASSGANLTLSNGSSKNMDVVLADSTNNEVLIDNAGNITINSNISGSSKLLTVDGAGGGDLILAGTNTFTGGITVNGAKVRLNATTALPTSGNIAVNNGGRLRFNASGTFGGVGQTLTLNPNQTANPVIDIQSGPVNAVFQGNVVLSADSRIEVNSGTSTLEFSGVLSGSGALIKQATGTLIVSGQSNTATGGTQVGNGAVTVNSGSSLGTGALVMASSGSAANNTTLTLNNAAQTVGGLSSSFVATTGTAVQTITLNGTALTVNQTADGTYGVGGASTLTSTIAGTGSLTKSGSAMLTLTNATSYSGATKITGGTLMAAASGGSALASTSSLNVTGGTLLLGASNQINNSANVTLGSGGKLATGGFSEGTSAAGQSAQLGALILGAGSFFDFATGANGSSLLFSGLTYTSGDAVSVQNWTGTAGSDNGASTNDRLLFASDPGLSPSQLQAIQFFDDSGSTLGSGAKEVAFNGYTELVPLVAVPEPRTIFGAAALLALIGWRERRRVRHFCGCYRKLRNM